MKKKQEGSYGFEFHAPMKLNVTQELSQKEAAITYFRKHFSGKRGCWILAEAKAALGGFAHCCHLFSRVESPEGSSVAMSLTLPVSSSFAILK